MMVMVSGRKGRIKQLLICYRRFTGIHYTCIMHTCVITYFVFAVIMVHGRNVFCISNILCTSAQLQATIRKKKKTLQIIYKNAISDTTNHYITKCIHIGIDDESMCSKNKTKKKLPAMRTCAHDTIITSQLVIGSCGKIIVQQNRWPSATHLLNYRF